MDKRFNDIYCTLRDYLFLPLLLLLVIETGFLAMNKIPGQSKEEINGQLSLSNSRINKVLPNVKVDSKVNLNLTAESGSNVGQMQTLFASIDNKNENINAIGIWSDAAALVNKTKVWGGTISARSESNVDSQLTGLEVDLYNGLDSKIASDLGKSGIKIAGFNNLNNNALHILSDGKGNWINGILFDQNSIAANGTLIGASGRGPYNLGIDFSNSKFNDSAIRLANNQKIRFDSPGGSGLIYTSEDEDSSIVMVVPKGGLKIVNSQGKVLFQVEDK